MHDIESAGGSVAKERVPADFVAAVLATRDRVHQAPECVPLKLPAGIYGVMTATALLTFATLMQGYELFFTHPLYA